MNLQEVAITAVRQLSKQPRITDWLGSNTSWENPFADERSRYPYPRFERERQQGNVYWHKLYRTWVVLGYTESQEVLSSPDFSSGTTMGELAKIHPYRRLSPGALDFVKGLLIFADGSVHARLRRLVSRAFTPRQVVRLEPMIAEIARDLLADLDGHGTTELYSAYTSKLPVHVIGELLGIPKVRWDWLKETSNQLTKLFDPLRGFDPTEMEVAICELRGYILALADVRRTSPTNDLLSALVELDDGGDQLTTDELVALVGTLILGGSETTTGLMGNALVHLVRYPVQRAALRRDPGLWPNAIEEFLRYDPPITFAPRTATRDTKVGDTLISAGQPVEVMIAAANRDPRKYDEPNELLLDRRNPTPLSFGHGIHYCIGAALSRTTTRIGLAAFLDAFGEYQLDVDAVEWRKSPLLRGPTGLPVRLGAPTPV